MSTLDVSMNITSAPSSLNWLSITMSSNGQYIAACAANNNNIYVSNDFGVNWAPFAPNSTWGNISMSSTGQYIVASNDNTGIYVSANFGNSWTLTSAPNLIWTCISISSTGQYIAASVSNADYIYVSANFGNSWTLTSTPALNWTGVAINSTGQHIAACGSTDNFTGNYIYTNANFGIGSWTQATNVPLDWTGIAINSTGQYIAGVVPSNSNYGIIYISSNFGSTWTIKNVGSQYGNYVSQIKMSSNGQYMIAISVGQYLFVSSDFGINWSNTSTLALNWTSITMSSSGQYIADCVNAGGIYTGYLYNYMPALLTSGSSVLQNYNITINGGNYTVIINPPINQGGCGVMDILNLTNGYSTNISFNSIYSTDIITQNQISILNNFTSVCDPDIQIYFSYGTGELAIFCPSVLSTLNIEITGSFSYSLPSTSTVNSTTTTGPVPGNFTPIPFYSQTIPDLILTSAPNKINWQKLAMSSNGQYIAACCYYISNYIYVSKNSGDTWNYQTDPSGNWQSIAVSSTGQYMAACISTGYIYVSSDYGTSWGQTSALLKNWSGIAISSSGQYIAACINNVNTNNGIYLSSDYGSSWTLTYSKNALWSGIAINSSGQYIVACIDIINTNNGIYLSSDYGSSWALTYSKNALWSGIAINSSGQYIVACINSNSPGNGIYLSSDYGSSWGQINTQNIFWNNITISSTGQYIAVSVSNDVIYTSTDYGTNWSYYPIFNPWFGVTISSNGQYIAACANTGGIYTSYIYNIGNQPLSLTNNVGVLQNYNNITINNNYTIIINPVVNNGGTGVIDIFNLTNGYSTNISFNSIFSNFHLTQNRISILNNQTSFFDPTTLIYFSYTTGQLAIYSIGNNTYNIEITGSFSYSLPNKNSLVSGSGNPSEVIPDMKLIH